MPLNLFGEPDSSIHCTNLAGDRSLGEWAEKQFCRVATANGKMFTPHQIGRPHNAACAYHLQGNAIHPLLLPDVTVWSAPGEHHEIKTKTPTKFGCFGLEMYRLEALLRFARECQQTVLYTILDWSKVGKFAPTTVAENWITAPVSRLERLISIGEADLGGRSWVAGRPKSTQIYYWKTGWWDRLSDVWGRP